MKEKSKKILIILSIVFSLILIGICIFFIYDSVSKTNDNQNNKEDNKQNEEEVMENNKQNEEVNVDDIAATLLSKFNYGKYRFSVQLFANNSSNFYDYNNLPTRYKNGVALLNTTGEVYEQGNYKYRWKKDEVDNKYRELFGNDKKIESNTDGTIDVYKSVSTDATLNSDDNYYYSYSISPFSWTTTGGELIEEDFFEILNSTLNGDILEVTFKYATIEGVINKNLNKYNIDLYSKINLTGNDINETLIEEINCSKEEYNFCKFFNNEYTEEMKKEDTEKIVSKYSDKLDAYKYTFKYDKEHKNYYFYSIEKL